MNEESQVRGCYNITFFSTPTRKQCRLSPELNTGPNSKQTACLCRDTGGKRELPTQPTSFNTLDNWGHKTPTQSKRKRNWKEKVKGSWPETCIQYTQLQQYFIIVVIIIKNLRGFQFEFDQANMQQKNKVME